MSLMQEMLNLAKKDEAFGISDHADSDSTVTKVNDEHSEAPQRAPKGTVRPAILAELNAPGITAMSPDTILKRVHDAGHTMIKSETIRTTLHKMVAEGLVTRREGLFYLVRNKNPDALASGGK